MFLVKQRMLKASNSEYSKFDKYRLAPIEKTQMSSQKRDQVEIGVKEKIKSNLVPSLLENLKKDED